jgi:O-antigen ligase
VLKHEYLSTRRREERRQQANQFIWEMPFWLALSVWSLLPATWTPWFDLLDIPVRSKDLLLLIVTGLYVPQLLRPRNQQISASHTVNSRAPWHYRIPTYTLAVLLYAAMSTFWSGMSSRNIVAMIYTLVLAAASVSLAYALIEHRSPSAVSGFLWRLTVYLASLSFLYTAESLFSFGSFFGVRAMFFWTDFGILRVRGPLFGSSVGHFILIPAFGFAIHKTTSQKTSRLFNSAVAFSLMVATIGLGSRAGLAIITIFLILLLGLSVREQYRLQIMMLTAIIIAGAWAVIFSRAQADRLWTIEDNVRELNHQTAWRIVTSRPIGLDIVGSGYGSFWPWYLPDVEQGGAMASGLYINTTPYGLVVYHPHSTFLLLGVELGAIGLIYFFFLLIVAARVFLRGQRRELQSIFAYGVSASFLTMFFDTLLFKAATLNIVWWIFLFGLLATGHPTTAQLKERLEQ